MLFRKFFLLLLLALIFLSQESFSQARPAARDTMLYRIETDDGNVYHGYILDQKPAYVILETENIGTITVQMERVIMLKRVADSLQKIQEKRTGKYSRPQETTYHFTPSGYGLKKGEGYYQNAYLFINQFYVGVNDFFTLGGGLIPLPLEGTPIWITPKFSIPIIENRLNFGLGSLNGYTLGSYSESFGVIYANLTFGSRERNFSIGVGKGYNEDGLAFSISGAYQVGEHLYLVTENYTIHGMSLGSVGGRYVWPNISIEYSILYMYDYDYFNPVPYIGVIVPFGHNK